MSCASCCGASVGDSADRDRAGLAATFDRNAPATLRVLLVGTYWILPLAYFIRNIPVVTNAVEGSLRQMDPSLQDAARGLGGSWWLTMRRVVIPAARPGLVAGTMLAAIAAVGEFVASVVLYTHSNRPISIEILAQLRSLSFGTAAAYSVLLIVLVLAITVGAPGGPRGDSCDERWAWECEGGNCRSGIDIGCPPPAPFPGDARPCPPSKLVGLPASRF